MVGREGKLRQKADLDLTSESLDVILGCSCLELVLTPGRKWPGLEITLRTGAECRNSTPKDFFLCFLSPGVKGQSPCLHCGLIFCGFGGERKQAGSLPLTEWEWHPVLAPEAKSQSNPVVLPAPQIH